MHYMVYSIFSQIGIVVLCLIAITLPLIAIFVVTLIEGE